MRRWNGWGDDASPPIAQPGTIAVLEALLGPGRPPHDAALDEVVRQVPPSRLAPHPLVSTDADDRVRHCRGQSFPDLIALRSGTGLTFPDGVSRPGSGEDVRTLLAYAARTGATVIPYGGGTSVTGHVSVLPSATPVLTMDLSRLDGLHRLDESSGLATFGPGTSGRRIESLLHPRGFTLGHFPQSFEYSTVGGWVATRSKGQQSLHYGGIDRLFAGGTLETPAGTLELPPLVASAAGPDLREVVLGSEGRLGVLTAATVRVSPLPAREEFAGFFFATFDDGVAAVRAAARARLPLSMLRLSDATETALSIASAGHERAGAVRAALRDHGFDEQACLLVLGTTGTTTEGSTAEEARALLSRHGAVDVAGDAFGRRWQEGRFAAPYLRNQLWEQGYAVDTVETATDWTRLDRTRAAIQAALRDGLVDVGEKVTAFTHLSHVYPGGSSIYTTFVFRLADDAAETLRRWTALKQAVNQVVVAHGATISHQHGVGLDHREFLEPEKGRLGLELIRAMSRTLDPHGILNPGKLVS